MASLLSVDADEFDVEDERGAGRNDVSMVILIIARQFSSPHEFLCTFLLFFEVKFFFSQNAVIVFFSKVFAWLRGR
jgi:hypothetical protein